MNFNLVNVQNRDNCNFLKFVKGVAELCLCAY